jgi:MOSC domain-containing protein YiiM
VTVTTDRSAAGESTPAPLRGRVESIHIADTRGAPMHAVDRITAVAGVGLRGDRHAKGASIPAPDVKDDQQLTLVAGEEIDRLADVFGIFLEPGETRRNVTTRGIDVNALVGRRFRIGDVECEGTRLCEPCQYLTDLVGQPILEPLVHRAGLRARIHTGGEIAVGAEVIALD